MRTWSWGGSSSRARYFAVLCGLGRGGQSASHARCFAGLCGALRAGSWGPVGVSCPMLCCALRCFAGPCLHALSTHLQTHLAGVGRRSCGSRLWKLRRGHPFQNFSSERARSRATQIASPYPQGRALLVVVSGACGSALAAAADAADVRHLAERLLDIGRHPRPERGQGGD